MAFMPNLSRSVLPAMTPKDVYEAFYGVTQIAETGYFATKRYCLEDFAEHGDDASAEMMQFDIIDETSHVEYGRLWLGEIASRAASDEMLAILQQQFYRSRLPQRIAFRAAIAHKTGDWSPIAGHDVGIISSASGPIVVAVFVSQNRGDFFEVEATHGRIAEAVLDAWGEL